MNKIINHFKSNAIIYLILLLAIVILCIAVFVKEAQEPEEVDTSSFNVVSLKGAIKFFESDEPHLLVISAKNCQATVKYEPSLSIASAKQQVKVDYLELTDIDKESEEDLNDFFEFQKLLDLDYTFRGETKKLGEFIGNTPMNVIIKNKKVVFAYIGSMATTTVESLMMRYF